MGQMKKPYTHFKTVCISMYNDDLTILDNMVETLKKRGQRHANRSALVRHALRRVQLDRVQLVKGQ